MAYSEAARRHAQDTLEERRLHAAHRADIARKAIYEQLPEVKAIEEEIAAVGVNALRASLTADGADAIAEMNRRIAELRERLRALLAEAGYSEDALSPKPVCPLCGDTGIAKDGSTCPCVKRLLSDYAMQEMRRVSPLELCRFGTFSLDYYPDKVDEDLGMSPRAAMRRNLEVCTGFAEMFPHCEKSLLMMGDAGLGKTHLALSIASRLLERGFDVLYCSAANVFRQIETEYFENRRDASTLESLKACSLLVLDDIGAEFNNAFVRSTLYDIVNARLCAGRLTIYTTNLTEEAAMVARYSEKVSSRLIGGCDILPFFGDDIRMLKNRG